MIGSLRARSAARRRFRREVVRSWSGPGRKTVTRLYGKGLGVQHYVLDAATRQALCGSTVRLVSAEPFEGRHLRCPMCVSVIARVLVQVAAPR